MEIYKHNSILILKLSNNEYIPITRDKRFRLEYYSEKNYLCSYELEIDEREKIDLYEILFNENLKKQIIKFEPLIPSNIKENCMKCTYYLSCKYDKDMLKHEEKTNEILKEYKDFIKSIKDGE